MESEKRVRRPGDHGRRERRPGHPHVARRDCTLGRSRRQCRARRNGRGDPATGRRELGLEEAVAAVAVRGPRCGEVVGRRRGPFVSSAPTVRMNGSLPGACAMSTPPGVPKFPAGCDDEDAVEPELLDGGIERVVREARLGLADEREVRDADVVLRGVLQDPVARGDDVARVRGAVGVRRPDADDRRARSDPG